jgi:hypothetical protein
VLAGLVAQPEHLPALLVQILFSLPLLLPVVGLEQEVMVVMLPVAQEVQAVVAETVVVGEPEIRLQ